MNYIIYDLEATCYETPPPDFVQETIEIGALRVNDYGEVRGSFSRFVRPVINPSLSDFCRNLTTIDQADINRASTFPAVIKEFKTWARVEEDDEYVLCSWGWFDKKLLKANCLMHKLEAEWLENSINLKEQYRTMTRMKQGMGLKRAVQREQFEFTGVHHRGISDAENLTKVFLQHFGQWKI